MCDVISGIDIGTAVADRISPQHGIGLTLVRVGVYRLRLAIRVTVAGTLYMTCAMVQFNYFMEVKNSVGQCHLQHHTGALRCVWLQKQKG